MSYSHSPSPMQPDFSASPRSLCVSGSERDWYLILDSEAVQVIEDLRQKTLEAFSIPPGLWGEFLYADYDWHPQH